MVKILKKRLKDQRGLTLIELLAVIVILGIIAAIAIPSIGNIIAKSEFDASKADAVQIYNAANLYLSSEGSAAHGTYSSSTATDTDLLQYLEISDDNLETWSVTIAASGITVTASSTDTGFGVEDANLEEINEKKFGE